MGFSTTRNNHLQKSSIRGVSFAHFQTTSINKWKKGVFLGKTFIYKTIQSPEIQT